MYLQDLCKDPAVQRKPKNELGSLKSGNLGCCLAVALQCVFCRVVHIIGKALIGVLWAAAAQSSALAAPSSILCTLVPLFFLLSLAVGSFFFWSEAEVGPEKSQP